MKLLLKLLFLLVFCVVLLTSTPSKTQAAEIPLNKFETLDYVWWYPSTFTPVPTDFVGEGSVVYNYQSPTTEAYSAVMLISLPLQPEGLAPYCDPSQYDTTFLQNLKITSITVNSFPGCTITFDYPTDPNLGTVSVTAKVLENTSTQKVYYSGVYFYSDSNPALIQALKTSVDQFTLKASPTGSPALRCGGLGSLAGDIDCDGKVNLIDFDIWRREFTKVITSIQSDLNSDGQVTLADFQEWRQAYIFSLTPVVSKDSSAQNTYKINSITLPKTTKTFPLPLLTPPSNRTK